MTRNDGLHRPVSAEARGGGSPEDGHQPNAERSGLRAGRSPTSMPSRPRVNCFTPGTRIATPRGEVAIEHLRPGDRVVTRDNGPQEVRWTGKKHLEGPLLRLDSRLRPVVIRAGALGPELPARDLSVSPAHRVLLLGAHPDLEAGEPEVFVSARHLVGTRGVVQAAVEEVTYLHFMCDRHEVVLSDGAWTESLQPSDDALKGLADRAREELFELFPDLRDPARNGGFGLARPMAGRNRVKKLGA